MVLLDKSCIAPPGHTKFLKNRIVMPVVVSAKRFDAIMYRSRMGLKQDMLEAKAEDDRYMQYLKDGNDELCKHFTNMGAPSLDEEKQAKLDQELREAEIREKQVKMEDDRLRKERIMRANKILEDLKPGQRALHHALVESEMSHQRKYHAALNREIIEDGERQERLDEQQCPQVLIPFTTITEEEIKAQEEERAKVIKADFLKDIEERRLRKIEEREQEVYEGIVEREQYKCLHEEEKKAAAKLAESKREFCRQAYRDALKEKAKIATYKKFRNKLEDRIICVDVTSRRNLDKRHNKEYKAVHDQIIKDRQDRAVKVCQLQQAEKRRLQQIQTSNEDRYEAEVEMDEARRQCQKQELAKQRRAYQLVEQNQAEEKRKRDAQIRTFRVAERLKNEETNKRFYVSEKRRKDKVTADLRHVLHGQRDEFLERRQEELMRMSACQADPSLQDDVNFFEEAAKMMQQARKLGRPVYPIAKAVEKYRRQNQIDFVPEGRMVRRNKIRDYCWPGYFSQADLAYKNYEHKEKCRQEQEKDRHDIFTNCIRITKMAAEEEPYKPCIMECPMKCFQHRGMPAMEAVDSFDCCKDVCYEDVPPIGPCPSNMQVIESCKDDVPKQECLDVKSPKKPQQSVPSQKSSNISKAASNQARQEAGGNLLSYNPHEPTKYTIPNQFRTWR